MRLNWYLFTLLLLTTPVRASEKPLARLSFGIPSERMEEFASVYERQFVPILEKYGLVQAAERDRAQAENIFSRLLELERPDAIIAANEALRQDPTWRAQLQKVARDFAPTAQDSLVPYTLQIYRTPAGPGRRTEVGAGFRKGQWHSLGVQDGLPASGVFSILQDRDGHLWFGMETAGLCRFDGHEFATWDMRDGLPGNAIWDLQEDREGNLWFVTSGYTESIPSALVRYDGEEFTVFSAVDVLFASGMGSTAGWLSRLLLDERDGAFWISAYDASEIYRYDGREFTRPFSFDEPTVLEYQDLSGNLWFIADLRAMRYDGEKFTVVAGAPGSIVETGVYSVFEDRDRNLWFGLQEGGVLRYDGRESTVFTAADGLSSGIAQSFAQDREGHIWIRTYGAEGISVYDGRRIRTFTTEDGLINNQVRTIYEDREGHIWFATIEGVSRYDGARFTTFTTEDGLPSNGVMALLENRQGDIWAGTFHGYVSRFDGASFTQTMRLGESSIWAMAEDAEGGLWFSEPRPGPDWGGVFHYDGGEITKFDSTNGLPDNEVFALLSDRVGKVWLGSGRVNSGGLTRRDGKTFTTFTTRDGLPDHRIQSLLEDRQGNIWAGTFGGGISRFDGETFTNFNTDDGLVHHSVWSMAQDREGHLWFGTFGGGVSRFDGQVFQTLSKRDGLPNNAVHQVLQDRRGDMWIATEGGVVRYRSSRIVPKVQITNVIAEYQYGAVEQLRLPSSREFVIFEFKGSSFTTHPDNLVYVYRLQGFDDSWHPSRQRRAEFRDLPRGRYVFEVKSVDRDLNYSEPARVHLEVHLPYERLAVLASMVLAALLIAWQTGRLVQRDRRLRESNAELRNEIRERERLESERLRLDEQLQQLRYLDRLRSTLDDAPTLDDVMQRSGHLLMDVLTVTAAGARLECDARSWSFGSAAGRFHFHRPLVWGERERGRLYLFCDVDLSEAQQRALLDETVDHIGRVLQARELTAQLLQSGRLVSLGQMAAGVAHELNQPLGAISALAGNVHLRLTQGRDVARERLEEMMRDVLSMVERMADTIGHLRIFSRDAADEPGALLSLNEVVHASLKVISAQLKNHGIALDLQLAEDLPPVYGHANQLEQVVLNLLANGRDALDERAASDGKLLQVRTYRDETDQLMLEVADNGTGIEAEHLARLFEPFFTTKEADRGTGLGLSISYAIVRNHDGHITCESRRGEGATFRVALPTAEEN